MGEKNRRKKKRVIERREKMEKGRETGMEVVARC